MRLFRRVPVEPSAAAERAATVRLGLVGLAFTIAMGVVAVRFGEFAARGDAAAERAPKRETSAPRPLPRRAEIHDRHGAPLALGVRAYAIHFDTGATHQPDEALEAAQRLAAALGLDPARLARRFARGGTPQVLAPATPAQAQKAHNLGLPGVTIAPRVQRVSVAGRAFAHVLGRVDLDNKGATGLEAALEPRLAARPQPAPPLRLTLDARVQRQTHAALGEAIAAYGAIAGAAVILDVESGAVRALVSLPDFDPARPGPVAPEAPGRPSPQLPRAAAGLFELGSTFKIFTWALALEHGIARMGDVLEAPRPFKAGGHTFSDPGRPRGPIGFEEAFARSSNVIAARLALAVGRERQQRLFTDLGLRAPTPIELIEARGVVPRWHEPWGPATTAAASYGHGVSVTPLHLAAAAAATVNGGWRVRPTLLAETAAAAAEARRAGEGTRVLARETSQALRRLMRRAVLEGTGRAARLEGLDLGGKTGTANKIRPEGGGYLDDKVIATFVAAWPMAEPRYVLVAMLDEPETADGRRGAGATAAPAARAILERVAPLLGFPSAPVADLR